MIEAYRDLILCGLRLLHTVMLATPGISMHFTPAGSSWINQVERWFGYLTDQLIRREASKRWRTTSAPG